ncbi:MAG: MerR family DNA-binding transcriptional regulator [Aquabacterium sp.]|nr:MerR family DNA-binding transcriptional regulator [Aquabacterium sp.]
MDSADVARRTGIAASALRYFERRGLITSVGPAGIRRRYAPGVLDQRALIALGPSDAAQRVARKTLFHEGVRSMQWHRGPCAHQGGAVAVKGITAAATRAQRWSAAGDGSASAATAVSTLKVMQADARPAMMRAKTERFMARVLSGSGTEVRWRWLHCSPASPFRSLSPPESF